MPAEKVAARKKPTSNRTPKRKASRPNKVEKPEAKEVRKTPKSPSVENVPKSRVAQTGRGAKAPSLEDRKAARPARHNIHKQAPNLTRAESPSKKDGKYTEEVEVPFAPGQEVQVHRVNETTVEASRAQRPFGPAVQKAKVTKHGKLNLKVEEVGVYSLSAPADAKKPNGEWRHVKVPVK